MTTNDDSTRAEIERMQEAQGFTERHVDELDGQVREAFERIRSLGDRLDALEHRLKTLAEAGDVRVSDGAIDEDAPEFERPPHSSRARPGE